MLPHWYEQKTQRTLINSIETTRRGSAITGWTIKTYHAPDDETAATAHYELDQKLQQLFFTSADLEKPLETTIQELVKRPATLP